MLTGACDPMLLCPMRAIVLYPSPRPRSGQGTHTVQACALFDHFPRTQHLETAVHLAANKGWTDQAKAAADAAKADA